MISVLVSISLVMILFWMLQTKLREALWQELKPVQLNAIPLLIRSFTNQFITLSAKNSIAVASIDASLGLKSLRESFLLVCTHRVTLFFVGVLLTFSLSSLTLLGLFLSVGFLLLLFLKKWKATLQILMLTACFFVVYQFSFFTTSRWIFSQTESGLVYFLSDGRLPAVLLFLLIGFLTSFVLRIESLVILISSLLFFSGGLPVINAMALICGELLAFSLLWCFWSLNTDQIKKQDFKEIFLIAAGSVFIFLSGLFFLKTFGLLNVRIFGGIEDKKFQFLLFWGLFEAFFTALLMGWGHFRFHMLSSNQEVSYFTYQKSVWSNGGWIQNQFPKRLEAARAKHGHLQNMLGKLNEKDLKSFPVSVLKKTRSEVESLKRLIDQLESHN